MSRPAKHCARLPHDLELLLLNHATNTGLTVNEIIRMALAQYLYNGADVPFGPTEGYMQARKLAVPLCLAALTQALTQVPDNIAEALAWSRNVMAHASSNAEEARRNGMTELDGFTGEDDDVYGPSSRR